MPMRPLAELGRAQVHRHDAVGLLEISHGRTILDELGVRHHLKWNYHAAGLLLGADGSGQLAATRLFPVMMGRDTATRSHEPRGI
nr:hypothetical protein [Cyanobium sp. NS01]